MMRSGRAADETPLSLCDAMDLQDASDDAEW